MLLLSFLRRRRTLKDYIIILVVSLLAAGLNYLLQFLFPDMSANTRKNIVLVCTIIMIVIAVVLLH